MGFVVGHFEIAKVIDPVAIRNLSDDSPTVFCTVDELEAAIAQLVAAHGL